MVNHQSKIHEQLLKISDEQKQQDCFTLLDLMAEITGKEPKLWHGQMIGFGSYSYKYNSGREGEWFLTGFCPRKNNLVVYIVAGFKAYDEILADFGVYKTGSSCLYINTLKDIKMDKLKLLIEKSVQHMRTKYNIKV
ncbi:MAG: DUF1801 domain-containing protein [Bacteroidota bacterium]